MTKYKSMANAVLLCLAALIASKSDAAIIGNGGFELPVLNPGERYRVFPSGSTLEQWTVVGVGDVTLEEGVWTPSEGSQEIAFNAYGATPSITSIEQLFVTVPGQRYQVSFDVGKTILSGNMGVKALVFSATTPELGSLEGWAPTLENDLFHNTFTFSFIADTALTTLKISDISTGSERDIAGFPAAGDVDVMLDNVIVAAVPEPSTCLAGLGALAILGLFGWRNCQS